MSALLKNPTFLYGIAFTIFIALAYWKGRAPLLGWLDGEILKIQEELEQAQRLRAEAEETLAMYKKKQAEALAEANAIIAHAQEFVAHLKTETESKLKASLARYEQQAQERIRLSEAEAIADVKQAAIDMALDLAKKILEEKMDATTATKLTDQAIAAIKPVDAKAA